MHVNICNTFYTSWPFHHTISPHISLAKTNVLQFLTVLVTTRDHQTSALTVSTNDY